MKHRKLFLATVLMLGILPITACSAPTWKAAEGVSGSLVWKQVPGTCYYITTSLVALPAAAWIIGYVISIPKKRKEENWGSIGCTFLIALVAFILPASFLIWVNYRNNYWAETIKINYEGIERSYYPTPESQIVPGEKAMSEMIRWEDVVACDYVSGEFNVSTSKSGATGATWREGELKKEIILLARNGRRVELIMERRSFSTSPFGMLVNEAFACIFKGDNCKVSPQEERRLKTTIYDYLPDRVKEGMTAEDIDGMTL